MKTTKTLIVIATLAVSALTLAQFPGGGGGQGRGFGRGGMRMMGGMGVMPTSFLLQRQDVQEELKITDEQKDKLQQLREEFQQKMMAEFQNGGGGQPGQPPSNERRVAMQKMMEESGKASDAILTPEQRKRGREIAIQLAGSMAVTDKQVATDLGLTDAQKKTIADLQNKQQEANRALMEKARSGEIEWQQIGESMQKNSKVMDAEIAKVLTAEQRKKLSDMGGAKFTPKDDQ
jgi:Spy/CpxP family protein refolding chaperone